MAGTFNCPTCGAPLDYGGGGETMRCPYCNNSVIIPAELLHPPVLVSERVQAVPEAMKEVAVLMQNGQEIQAIKLYRQLTGCGLEEAKQAVEQLGAGNAGRGKPLYHPGYAGSPGKKLIPAERVTEMRQLALSGNKIEAIKIYRQITGLGLKESKEAVETMMDGNNPNGELYYNPDGPNKKNQSAGIGSKILAAVFGLFLLGLASIFPIVFIPMGMDSLQQGNMGGAVGAFIGAGVWALAWGGIGLLIIFAFVFG